MKWQRESIALGAVTLGLLLVPWHGLGGQPLTKKLPVPQQGALDRAEALVRELYREELEKAKGDPAASLKLAQTFLLEARETTDDPAGKYVLLRQAASHAAQSGDSATALEALEELALCFEIPPASLLSWETQALLTASKSAPAQGSAQGIVDAALPLLEEAVAGDDFANALALGAAAESAARKLKSVALVSGIRKRLEAVKALEADYAQVKPFLEALSKDPKNARANLEAGKYYALVRGNWDKGLPLLARGSDNALADLAAADRSEPQGWGQMAQLGVKWAKEAEQWKDQARVHAFLRANHWYQRALATAPFGENGRAPLEAAMQAVNDQLPPDQRAGEIAVELRRTTGHRGPVFSVAMAGDGSKIASAGADGSVRLWDAKTFKQLRRFDGHNGPVWTVQLAADGRHLVSGGFDKTIRLWDPLSGRESKRLVGHDDYVRSVCFSANGQLVLSGGDDRLVKLWDIASGSELKTLSGHDHFVFAVALARDGKRGLSASLDRTVRLWDLESGKTLQVLRGHTDTVLGVAFMPDGRRALSASTDKTLRLWDLASGQTLSVLEGHTGFVLGVAVSPDGRRALSAGQDGKVILWDLDHGKQLRTLKGHAGPVWAVAFSEDGRFAATAGNDGTVRLWGSAR